MDAPDIQIMQMHFVPSLGRSVLKVLLTNSADTLISSLHKAHLAMADTSAANSGVPPLESLIRWALGVDLPVF